MAVGLLVAACGSDTPAATPTAIPTVAGTRAPTLVIIPLGKPARSDDAEITINGIRPSDNEGDETPPDGFEWLLFDVSVQNTGAEPFTLYLSLSHADGRTFEQAHPPTSSPELDMPIAGGTSVQGEAAFLVDKGTLGGILIYGPGEARWALELGAIGKQ